MDLRVPRRYNGRGGWLRDGVKSRVPRYSLHDSVISRKKKKKKRTHETHTHAYTYACVYVYIICRGVVFLHRVDRVLWMAGGGRGITEIEILGKWEEEVTKGWMLNEQPIEPMIDGVMYFFFFLFLYGYGGWELFVNFSYSILFIAQVNCKFIGFDLLTYRISLNLFLLDSIGGSLTNIGEREYYV